MTIVKSGKRETVRGEVMIDSMRSQRRNGMFAASGTQSLFADDCGNARRLHGVALYSGSSKLAELAASVGFEVAWIEMEHASFDFGDVESMCVAVKAGGGASAVRVPDGQRHHVLRALEVGAQIVVVPMVDDADQARRIVEYGKFPPIGKRGYNTRSRGVGYDIADPLTKFERANATTHLFAQIETTAAVSNIEAICAVDGLSGIFLGPGDLSMSLGCAGNMAHPKLIDTVVKCFRVAKAAKKHTGILVTPGPLLDVALKAGCNLVIAGGDVADLSSAWSTLRGSLALVQSK